MSTLYAKITNEKGKTAGKGGNEYLDIDIQVGNQNIFSLTLKKSKQGQEKYILTESRSDEILASRIITGKTQKDKTVARLCSNCGHKYHLLAEMIGENDEKVYLCENCLQDSE